ncbi:MAG TPA: ABC transporter ATP-binding protein [Anaerolineae bacterium]|nr:ABC transporter ATP-binding protein [Anaerolineae bacterium]
MAQVENILQVKGVTKRFGGLTAVNNVTFDLPRGQILGLIGPNGAGKTTLFNVINGVYAPTEGHVIFKGTDISGWQPYDVVKLGLARTHQIVRPLNDLTVLENVMAGACYGHENRPLKEAQVIADEVMEFLGLAERRDMLAGSLNVAQKKRLEMARALASRPYMMLLDEVLAGLNPTEIAEMVEVVLKIREQGVTILIIEHVMHALMNVSDRVIVLDYGQLIAEGSPEEIANNPKVIEAYLGDPDLAKRLMENADGD